MSNHFLIHGSVHGITTEAAAHFLRFERAGGRVEMLHSECDAIVSYDGDGDQTTIESLIHILEQAGACAESAHGVITFGWSHQEPSHLHVGAAKTKKTKIAQPLWDALASIHLKEWMAKKLRKGQQPN
jgi:hypothetical protein